MKKAPKAVLWDLDGTILDSLSTLLNIFEEMMPEFGIAVLPREQMRREFYGSMEDLMHRVTGDNHDQEKLMETFLNVQIKHYENPATHHGMRDTINYFADQGYKQALVTSRAEKGNGLGGAATIIKTLGLEKQISVVISADDTTAHKPDPEPVLTALDKLGVEPANAVMIGDQPVDVMAAKGAGTYSILIDHDGTPDSILTMRKTNPDFYCQDADQIKAAVQKIFSA